MISQQKEDIEELQTKQKEEPKELLPKEKQMMRVVRGVFLEAQDQYAIQRIKEKNPEVEVFLQSLTWAKEEFEAIWSKTANRTLLLVNAINAEMRDNKNLLEQWEKVQELGAKCKLYEQTTDEVEKVLSVAVFTSSMKSKELFSVIEMQFYTL